MTATAWIVVVVAIAIASWASHRITAAHARSATERDAGAHGDALLSSGRREQELTEALARSQERERLLGVVCRVEARELPPLYRERPAPAELDAVAGRVRGLAFLDSVSVADASGLPLDRGANRDADDLAALVPAVALVASEVAATLGTVAGVAIHTADTRIAEFRVLPAWTGGAWLVAQSSSQRPPVGALDAAVAYARAVRDASGLPPPSMEWTECGRLGAGGSRTELLADELDRACRGVNARTIALVLGDQVLTGFQTDGLAPGRVEPVLRALHELQQIARARLRADAIARIELDLDRSTRLSLSSLGNGSRIGLLTLTVGRTLDALELERVVGRLRRFLDTHGPAVAGVGGPASATGTGAYA